MATEPTEEHGRTRKYFLIKLLFFRVFRGFRGQLFFIDDTS